MRTACAEVGPAVVVEVVLVVACLVQEGASVRAFKRPSVQAFARWLIFA
jgi:hypothetical protein